VQTPFSFPALNKEISNGSRYPHCPKIEKKKKKIEKTKKRRKKRKRKFSYAGEITFSNTSGTSIATLSLADINISLSLLPKGDPTPKKANYLKRWDAKLLV